MTGLGATLFVVTAIFAMAGALMTISARRPLRAAIGLLVHIISLAGMFLTLNAHLLAALQLLVYAGAIVVLFVFVIMLIGPAAEVGPIEGRVASRTLSIALTIAVVLALAVGWSAMYAPQAAYFAEMFEPQVRYSGMSIGAQLVAIVAGGPSPLIATAAVAATSGQTWPISIWLIAVSLITLLALAYAPETAGRDLGITRRPLPAQNHD